MAEDVTVENIPHDDIPADVQEATKKFIQVAGSFLVKKMEKGEELTGSLAFATEMGGESDPCILDIGVILNLQIIPKAALADDSVAN